MVNLLYNWDMYPYSDTLIADKMRILSYEVSRSRSRIRACSTPVEIR